MLLKLYKTDEDKTLYWEAWHEGDEIIIHFGIVGDPGETTNIPLPEFEPPETAIQGHADEAREAGFAEIDPTDLFELVVQLPVKAEGSGVDIEQAHAVEELLNECLGWNGVGHCDSSDVSDAVNVYCYVVDPHTATKTIVDELRAQDLLADVVVAYQNHDEEFVVLWPEGYTGIFHY